MTARLTLYARSDCHLCEDMEVELRQLQRQQAFELEVVDIDEDPQLRVRYDEWVPVLVSAGEELCHYHLDRERVLAVLRASDAHE